MVRILVSDIGYHYDVQFPSTLGGQSKSWERNLKFIDGYDILDIKENSKRYLQCDDNFKSQFHCFASKVFDVSAPICKEKCVPLFLKGFLNIVKPEQNKICETYSQDLCYQQNYDYLIQPYQSCFPRCWLNKYDVAHTRNPTESNNSTKSIVLSLISSSKVRTLKRQYYVYDTIGLIGTVGGSLGLFLGFSFFDVLCSLLDYILYSYTKYFQRT